MGNKNVELNVGGLKCDNIKCDYVDMSIPREKYIDYIDFPCPKCGESLLTREDYVNVLIMEDAVNCVNALASEDIEKYATDEEKKILSWIVDTHKGIKIIKKEE